MTLNSAYMGDPDATISNISNYMRETENVTTNTFDLDNMHASEMYTVDNVGYRMYLVCFTSNLTDDMIYLSVESPVSSFEEFKNDVMNIIITHSYGYFTAHDFDVIKSS